MLANHENAPEVPNKLETDRPTCPMCASSDVDNAHDVRVMWTGVPLRYVKCRRCLGTFKMFVSYTTYIESYREHIK